MIYRTPEDWFGARHRRVALFGMSGLGKTRIAAMLAGSRAQWFHYSIDFRIGTRYMGEHIVDNFKREAMRNPFLRELLRGNSIYIASNITFQNLAPLSTYLGKPGDPAKGGIPFEEYVAPPAPAPRRRDRRHPRRAGAFHRQGRGRSTATTISSADTSGSLSEVVDAVRPATRSSATSPPRCCRSGSAGPRTTRDELGQALRPCAEANVLARGLPDGALGRLPRRPRPRARRGRPRRIHRHGFRGLIAHRLPRYHAMAERWGVTVKATEVEAVRDPQDFTALVAEAIARTTA